MWAREAVARFRGSLCGRGELEAMTSGDASLWSSRGSADYVSRNLLNIHIVKQTKILL